MIGSTVKVIVDRPLGTFHPKHKDIYYSVNYGYIPNVMAPDGEEQDAYILGINKPVVEFVGRVIAIIQSQCCHGIPKHIQCFFFIRTR